MKKELEMKLVERYPTIFRDYMGPENETCMAFGMECGNGWFGLIDDMCSKITALIEGSKIKVVAEQVKEKFGGLRFYYFVENPDEEDVRDSIEDIVAEAENMSLKTCEVCGKPGEERGGRWIKTLCDDCCAK